MITYVNTVSSAIQGKKRVGGMEKGREGTNREPGTAHGTSAAPYEVVVLPSWCGMSLYYYYYFQQQHETTRRYTTASPHDGTAV